MRKFVALVVFVSGFYLPSVSADQVWSDGDYTDSVLIARIIRDGDMGIIGKSDPKDPCFLTNRQIVPLVFAGHFFSKISISTKVHGDLTLRTVKFWMSGPDGKVFSPGQRICGEG